MSISSSFPSIAPSLILDFAKSRRLDPRITFTRAQTGNIATYIGADGLIKYAGPNAPRFDHKQTFRTNLITYSEDFNQWVKENLNTTSWLDQEISPDGSQTADKLIPNTSLSLHRVRVTTAIINQDETVTASIFAKYGGTRYLNFGFGGSNNWENIVSFPTVIVDLLTGEFTFTNVDITPRIETYPNGWYRISFSAKKLTTGTTTFSVVVSPNATGTATHTGDDSSGIYVWGAQLEVSDAATAYIATGPSAVTRTATESLGLLVEEQRANLLPESEDLTSGLINKQATTTSNDTGVIAPDGTSGATRVIQDNTTAQHLIGDTASGLTLGGNYALSCFVKAGTTDLVWFSVNSYTNWVSDWNFFINLTTGSVYHNSSSISDANLKVEEYPNGWWKLSMVAQQEPAGGGAGGLWIGHANPDGTQSTGFAGDGSTYFYAWGFQMEEGSFPTSYIPTSGTAITRPRDLAYITGTNFNEFFNPNEGTFYSAHRSVPDRNQRVWSIDNGTSTINRHTFVVSTSGGSSGLKYEIRAIDGTLYQPVISSLSVVDGQEYKISGSYSSSKLSMSREGDPAVSTSTVILAEGLLVLTLGSDRGFASAPMLNGTIREFLYYPKQITDSQLQTLTK